MRSIRIVAACAAFGLVPAGVAEAHRGHLHDKRQGKRASTLPRHAKQRPALAARTDTRGKPVVFVHGLDAFGTAGVDCNGTFGDMINTLKAWGWTGTMATVKYYTGDTNCGYSLDHHGSHSLEYPRTDAHTSDGSHDMDGDIRHLAYHLAWMIRDHFGTQPVDAVGHSMGGLIIRYMVDQLQRGNPNYPSGVQVEDVVTFGTPHGGSGYASWCAWSYECNQMQYGSSFINYLASSAPNPQAAGGTDWTAIGSYSDGVVSQDSAVNMDATHKVKYLSSMGIGHSDYMHDTSDVRDSDSEYYDRPGPWYSWYDGPHAVRWADYSLLYGSW